MIRVWLGRGGTVEHLQIQLSEVVRAELKLERWWKLFLHITFEKYSKELIWTFYGQYKRLIENFKLLKILKRLNDDDYNYNQNKLNTAQMRTESKYIVKISLNQVPSFNKNEPF